MAPSIQSPVFYGVRDIVISDYEEEIRFFLYFPSLDGAVWTAPILDGSYPLVVFLHGNRTGSENEDLCPEDESSDYRRWWTVLHLLARCGFVVACPDLSGTISADPESTLPLIRRVIDFMYDEWEHRSVLVRSGDDPGGKLGIAGHSWGANSGLRLAVTSEAQAFAAVAGTWETGSSEDFRNLDMPILFASGTVAYDLLANSANQPYTPRNAPKHQAALAELGHWGWFRQGEIFPCSGDAPYPCTSGAHILSELLVAFFTRYLYDEASIVPYLLEDTGTPPNRASLDYINEGRCAARIRFRTGAGTTILSLIARWLTPNHLAWGQTSFWWRILGRYVKHDEVTVGDWDEGSPW